MSHIEYERLHHNLKRLKLMTIESILDNYLEAAANDGKSTIEILDHLIAQEVQSKESRSLAYRMRRAGFLWRGGSASSILSFSFPFTELSSTRYLPSSSFTTPRT